MGQQQQQLQLFEAVTEQQAELVLQLKAAVACTVEVRSGAVLPVGCLAVSYSLNTLGPLFNQTALPALNGVHLQSIQSHPELQPFCNDWTYVRYLRARGWSFARALKMLQGTCSGAWTSSRTPSRGAWWRRRRGVRRRSCRHIRISTGAPCL